MSVNERTKNKNRIRLTALCGIFAAVVFIGTTYLRIPLPITEGYVNLGDAFILIAAYLIGPAAFFPAAIGSALSDLIGFPDYAVPTFIIKGTMGLVAALIMSKSHGKKAVSIPVRVLAGIIAEAIMVGGYFGYESIRNGGIAVALTDVPFNLIQAGTGIIIAIPLTYAIRIKRQK